MNRVIIGIFTYLHHHFGHGFRSILTLFHHLILLVSLFPTTRIEMPPFSGYRGKPGFSHHIAQEFSISKLLFAQPTLR